MTMTIDLPGTIPAGRTREQHRADHEYLHRAAMAQRPAAWYGLKGDGVTDDTAALQAYLDAGAGETIYIPKGTYRVDAGVSLYPSSHTGIVLAPGAVLQVIPNDLESYAVFTLRDVTNVSITGGTLAGDRADHQGDKGQWGRGVFIEGSSAVTLRDVAIREMWGDGVEITTAKQRPTALLLDHVTVAECRRNGITVIDGTDITLRGCRITRCGGASPGTGIDIEPFAADQAVRDVRITHCHLEANVRGVYLPCDVPNRDVQRVRVDHCSFVGHTEAGLAVLGARSVTVDQCDAVDGAKYGLLLYEAIDCQLIGCMASNNNQAGETWEDIVLYTTTRCAVLNSQAPTYRQYLSNDTRTDGSLLGYTP